MTMDEKYTDPGLIEDRGVIVTVLRKFLKTGDTKKDD